MSIIKKSNFIKSITFEGGTFYTFQSAIEDFNVHLNDTTRKVNFSKYALLNIPNILTPTNKENTIQFDSIDGAFLEVTGSNNNDLAESFQNYCLNLETTVTAQPTYDVTKLLSVSERVFFKWLKELGAIRYRDASLTETVLASNTFVEEDTSVIGNQKYNRVVEHIGTIDVKNAVKDVNNSYSEIYIRIGALEGNTPTVLFKTVSDDNYSPDKVFRNLTDNPLNKEVLHGRDYNETHPTGLSIQAFYDNDGIADKTLNGVPNDTWYGTTSETNIYLSEPLTFEDATNDEIVLDDPNSAKTVDVFRSRLDGVMLDFEADNYKLISDSNVIKSIPELNTLNISQSFQFNAILVYYDVTDGTDTVTNLYGVLFLDDVKALSGGGGIINPLQKIRANNLINSNGNSFGLKINLKYDTAVENVGVEISVSSDNNVSMELFQDAITRLYQTIEIFDYQNNLLLDFNARVQNLETLILSNNDLQTLIPRVAELEQTINDLGILQTNSDEIKSLINSLNDHLITIMNNKTTVEVAYNTDVIKAGQGILIDKTIPNVVKIVNKQQEYNLSNSPIMDVSTATVFDYPLQEFTNYLRHENVGTIILTDNILININEGLYKWQKGQVFRFSIASPITFDGFSMKIAIKDIDGLELYSFVLTELDFLNTDTKLIEFICLDPLSPKDFRHDVIK